jgi:glycine hydroxymethyltransferase
VGQLERTDPQIFKLIRREELYQAESIRLIPSENYVSAAVLEATGSILTNKYSEGYAGRRYYQGQFYIDEIESLVVERAKSLFRAEHANVQPYSGSPANLAVYFALLKPGDGLMGLALPHGGHLTHGWNVSITGNFWRPIHYTVNRESQRLDYDAIRDLARKERPKIIVTGATAYPRQFDFKRFAEIAKEVDAYLLADISHIAGLIVAGAHPDPFPHADIVMTTTHKTLRGPRGAVIMCRKELAEKIDKAVFPGLQGGPHNHTTAAIGVALKEAATPEFKEYGHQVVRNARVLAAELLERGFNLVSGGTDNHLLLIDLTNKKIIGKKAAQALDRAGIICNYNTVPFDPRKPFSPSGIRLGTPAVTSRGMKEADMRQIGLWIDEVITHIDDEPTISRVCAEVREYTRRFAAPGVII